MRFHASVVDKVLQLCANYGGHADERKLAAFIADVRVTPYPRSNPDARESMVLVDTTQYINERNSRGLITADIIPMVLHNSVQTKIIELYKTYSGHTYESKLRKALSEMDFTPYEQKTTGGFCIVLMSDYMKALRGAPTNAS